MNRKKGKKWFFKNIHRLKAQDHGVFLRIHNAWNTVLYSYKLTAIIINIIIIIN